MLDNFVGLAVLAVDSDLFLDLLEIQASDLGFVTVDDLGELLEGGALGFDVHEVNEAQLTEDPACVDEVQLPAVVLAEAVERERVHVGVEAERGLDADVEDHEALGSELVREDLDGVAD